MPKRVLIYGLLIMSSMLLYGCEKQNTTNKESMISSTNMTYECKDIVLQDLIGEIQQCRVKDSFLYILTKQDEISRLYRVSIDGSHVEEIHNTFSQDEK